MSRSYSLNPTAAASAGVSNYITETGKYVGRFTRAEIVKSKAGTEGVELDFVANDGRSANYLQLWTYNVDGKELPSLKALSAILACLRLRNIDAAPITVTDRDGGQRNAQGFLALTSKPIGLLLQREEYQKSNGDVGYKFNLVAPFDASSELTAGEILAKKAQPEQLAKMVSMLKDKPMQASKQRQAAPHQGGDLGMDDDIPF